MPVVPSDTRSVTDTSRLCARRSLDPMLTDYQQFIARDIENALTSHSLTSPLSQVPYMNTTILKCILISDLLAGLCSWLTHHSRYIPEALFLYCHRIDIDPNLTSIPSHLNK